MSDDQPGALRTQIQHLLNENQDPDLVEKIFRKVSEILTKEESITYVCVQKRPVVNPMPDAIVLTTRRFIVYRPKLLGRVVFEDHIWRDLHGVHLVEGVIGATITITTADQTSLEIGFLPKNQARKVYALAQEQEERVLEERRRRELEDKRAAAGGIVMHQPSSQEAASSRAASDPVERLRKLKEMADAGLISPGEFEAKRAEIIAGM